MSEIKTTVDINQVLGTGIDALTPLTNEASFMDEVEASFDLSWAGQMYMNITDDKTFLEQPIDHNFNAIEQIQGTHYQAYESHFDDIRNEEHLNYVKDKIDYNNYQRSIRDDAGILPELVAALGDPLTYVPIPFVKGVTFASRFVKGGAATGALVASTEPIRQSLDPTATLGESVSYISAAFLMGGGFTGAFGRRLPAKHASAKSEQDLMEDSFGAAWDMENDTFTSKMYDENSPVKYETTVNEQSVGFNLETINVRQTDEIGKRKYVHIKDARDRRSRVDIDTIAIDEARINKDFNNGKYRISGIPGVKNLPEFASPEDFKKFLIEKETIKFIKGAPDGKTAVDKENALNLEVLENIRAKSLSRKTAGVGKKTDWFAERVDRFVTDFGALTNNKFKTSVMRNQIADTAIALFGDHATVLRANKAGAATEQSAMLKATLEHFQTVSAFDKALHEAWKFHRLGKHEANDKVLGYDFGATGLKAKDKLKGALNKAGANFDKQMTFQEFNEIVGKAVRDPEFKAKQSDAIKEFVDVVDAAKAEIGKQAKDLGMFQSQDSITKIKLKFAQSVKRGETQLAEYKKTNPGDKARIKLLQAHINKAKEEVQIADDLLEDIKFRVEEEFDPLVDNYLNRVYDKEKIMQDIVTNDVNFLPPATITNPISVKKGLVKGMVIEHGEKGQKKLSNIKEILDDGRIVTEEGVRVPKNGYRLKGSKIDNIDDRFYSIPDPNSFRGKVFQSFSKNPRVYTFKDVDGGVKQVLDPDSVYLINHRVQETLDNLTFDMKNMDMDGDLGILNAKDKIQTGYSSLMSRKLNMTDAELDGFLINDINYLFRNYSDRMHKRINVTKRFGDSQMKTHLWETEFNLLLNEKDTALIGETMQTLRNSRDKVYGVYNTGDPDSFFQSRLPNAFRNWASTAMMGKVYLSSLVDIARIPMVHGFTDTMKVMNSKNIFSAGSKELNSQLAQNKWLGDAYDVVMNTTSIERIISQQERIGSGSTVFGRYFDKIVGKPLQNVQAPFYHANLLSPHTQLMKEWAGHVSVHRFLQDSVKVANGTATKFDLERLASYGINKQTARAIGKLPIKKTKNGLHYLNQADALATKNGLALSKKLQYATFADVQRTIITPSIADKPNMMFGVIQINNDKLAKALDNDLMAFFGFEKTQSGGKINNGFLSLPLQFFAWSFASNRKLMLSALSGRESRVIGGAGAMVAFGAMGDYLKNPQYYQHKTWQERTYRAIEMSGVAGLPADFNFMFEVVSEGMFDTPMGVRPMIGTPGRFGEANAADATGEFIGAGPGMMADLIYAFNQDLPYDEKAATIRRLIPFNNLLWFNNTFRKIYDTGAEIIR